MNIPLPLQNSHKAFALFLMITLLFSIVAILLFRRNRWL
jgi:Mg2+ and Co2+ transporter CorA